MKQEDLRVIPQKPSKSVCTSRIVVFSDPLSLPPSISSAMKTAENTETEPNDVEAEDDGGIQMEYCCDKLCIQRARAVTKIFSAKT